jgi:hypothetical protein
MSDAFGPRTKIINTIRVTQQQAQGKAITDRHSCCDGQLGAYSDRDALTGDRLFTMPDGGQIRQNWISNSKPAALPPLTIPSGTIGLPGYSSQKPR